MGILASPTALELLEGVRDFLGEPDATNSKWSDKQLMKFLNEGARRYFGEVIQNAEGQFDATTTLNVVSGTETVALPATCFKVNTVFIKDGDDWLPLAYDNFKSQAFTTQGGTTSKWRFTYHFRGNNLVIRPTPQFSETGVLLLDYVAFPDTIVTGGDTLTSGISPIFKDLIEMYAVYKAKLMESVRGNNVDLDSKVAAHLADLYDQFKKVIEGRSNYPIFTRPYQP